MKIFYFIFLFMLCHLLFSANLDEQLTHDSPIEISLTDTSGLDLKLKQFLDSYYQKNYPDDAAIKAMKSMQYVGTFEINKKISQLKVIKKRPNKYKSSVKDLDNSELITIFDGENLKLGKKTGTDPTINWQTLDTNAPENIWVHYDQIFDSIMLNPKDPNKKISLGKAYKEEDRVIQPIIIELKDKIKITNFISVRDNLIKKCLLEFNGPKDPKLNSYYIYYENYELINGIMIPKKVITKFNDGSVIINEFTQVQFNLGISDFFFKAISL